MKLTGRGCFGSRTSTIVKPSLNIWPIKACPLCTMTCTPSPRPFKSVLPTKSMLRADSGFMAPLPCYRHIDPRAAESKGAGPQPGGGSSLSQTDAPLREETMTQAARFRELMRRDGMVVAPGAYDCITARLI